MVGIYRTDVDEPFLEWHNGGIHWPGINTPPVIILKNRMLFRQLANSHLLLYTYKANLGEHLYCMGMPYSDKNEPLSTPTLVRRYNLSFQEGVIYVSNRKTY